MPASRSTSACVAALLFVIVAAPASADIASGLWAQHTRVLAEGALMQETDGKICHIGSEATDAGRIQRAQRNARRVLDSSCKTTQQSTFDPTRFSLSCSDTATGTGATTINESGTRQYKQHISFHNESAGGIDMQYEISAHWLGADCGSAQ